MNCPLNHGELQPVVHESLAVQQCQTCGGEWLAHDELQQLEAEDVSDQQALQGMIEYLPNPGDLKCPQCSGPMYEFDYRGSPVQLHACAAGHGYWLEGGAEFKIHNLMHQRVLDLHRAATAEASFGHFLDGLRRHYGGKHRPLL